MYHQLGQAVFFLLWGGVPYLIWWAGRAAEVWREEGRYGCIRRSCAPDHRVNERKLYFSFPQLAPTSYTWGNIAPKRHKELTVYGIVWICSLAHCPARRTFLYFSSALCPLPVQRGFVIRILLTMHVSSVQP